MKKLQQFLICLFMVLVVCFYTPVKTVAQNGPLKLSGPRIGLTVIGGEMAHTLDEKYDAFPLVTQFGWQFEWRYFSVDDGPTGVVELVPLIGGVEQGLFLPSINLLIGMRSVTGLEIGIGPNLSISGSSIVFAAGLTKTTGKINWPINFAILPSQKGLRFSVLFGFNIAE